MWSYGEICVGCGCCVPGAYKKRIHYHKTQLNDDLNFNNWCEDKRLKPIQEANKKANILYEKKMIKSLQKKIKDKKCSIV